MNREKRIILQERAFHAALKFLGSNNVKAFDIMRAFSRWLAFKG